jgi:hypothetical protein
LSARPRAWTRSAADATRGGDEGVPNRRSWCVFLFAPAGPRVPSICSACLRRIVARLLVRAIYLAVRLSPWCLGTGRRLGSRDVRRRLCRPSLLSRSLPLWDNMVFLRVVTPRVTNPACCIDGDGSRRLPTHEVSYPGRGRDMRLFASHFGLLWIMMAVGRCQLWTTIDKPLLFNP